MVTTAWTASAAAVFPVAVLQAREFDPSAWARDLAPYLVAAMVAVGVLGLLLALVRYRWRTRHERREKLARTAMDRPPGMESPEGRPRPRKRPQRAREAARDGRRRR